MGEAKRRKDEYRQTITPKFVFARRRDIELEAGFILAGQLVVDIPNIPKGTTTKLKDSEKDMIESVIQYLLEGARSGWWGDDDFIEGWPPGGFVPPNADDIMRAWAARSLEIAVRVDSRNNGLM